MAEVRRAQGRGRSVRTCPRLLMGMRRLPRSLFQLLPPAHQRERLCLLMVMDRERMPLLRLLLGKEQRPHRARVRPAANR
jgi:hypothetical protein